jgi:DNA repair exonuclease SbcCD ATPase subunit
VTVGAFEAQTAPVEAKRALHVRRGFAASSIAAALVAAALIGTAYVTRYAGQQDILGVSTIGGPVVEQATQWPSQDSRKTDSLALQQRTEADQASAQAVAQEAAQIKQAVEPAAPEARQSLEKEQRPEVLANELAEARRAIDGLNLQLRTEAENAAQLLGQEREKTAALVQEATAARQDLTASMVQHRHALEEERARSAALAIELAMAQRDIEMQALSSKTEDEVAQLKQAAESAKAELRQSLQKEHDRAEALASELARARSEIKTQVALLRKAGDETVQLKQAAESAMAELRQRGQAVEQKPAAVEERPGVSLPAWANSDAFVKPAQTAPDVTPENSKPAIKPVETVPLRREHAMSPDNGYSCQRYRTYDPASGSYRGYDGRRHSCP